MMFYTQFTALSPRYGGLVRRICRSGPDNLKHSRPSKAPSSSPPQLSRPPQWSRPIHILQLRQGSLARHLVHAFHETEEIKPRFRLCMVGHWVLGANRPVALAQANVTLG